MRKNKVIDLFNRVILSVCFLPYCGVLKIAERLGIHKVTVAQYVAMSLNALKNTWRIIQEIPLS